MAEFLFRESQMSAGKIDRLMHILAAYNAGREDPPFSNHKELYSVIDDIQVGEVPWQSFSVSYNGPLPESGDVPPWMTEEFEVWYRDPEKIITNQLKNPDFDNEIDYTAKRMFDAETGQQVYRDFMLGDFAWNDSVSSIFAQFRVGLTCIHVTG